MDEWAKRGPAIAKANLIANEHTLESLTRFNANLASKAAVLNALRVRLIAKTQERERLAEQMNRFTADNGSLIALLQQWNLAGTAVEPKRLEAWQQQFGFNKQQGDNARAEHGRISAEIAEEHIEFATKVEGAIAELTPLVSPMLKAARAELGLPFDADHYNKVIREAQEQAANDLAVVAAEVRSLIKPDQ